MGFSHQNHNISTDKKINALVGLGQYLNALLDSQSENDFNINKLLNEVFYRNKWFSETYVIFSIRQWSKVLTLENLYNWLEAYNLNPIIPKKVGLILPGNIPAVGFHDVICTWLSGHHPKIKLSSKDDILIPFFCSFIENKLNQSCFEIVEKRLTDFDAVIATGTNNTIHHFDYYFRKVPRLLRSNRSSVAVIQGNDSSQELEKLGKDLFTYYGLGCRNVSKIYLPENFKLNKIIQAVDSYKHLRDSSKYDNNLTYQKAVCFLQNQKFTDGGFFLMQESKNLHAPISMIYYEYYTSFKELIEVLNTIENQIQCIVSSSEVFDNSVEFGQTQSPQLWDYADGVDTMSFLENL